MSYSSDDSPVVSQVGPNPQLDQLSNLGLSMTLDPRNADRMIVLNELLDYCNRFVLDSQNWRRQSFETLWHLYQRNSDSIYDPALVLRKESWQSRAFIPMTASHRENIHAALFRMVAGARPPLEMRARVDRPNDQSDNIRDLIVREMEKSRFEVEWNKVLDDTTTYGSGFCRIRYETTVEPRRIRTPVQQPINVNDPQSIQQAMNGHIPVLGYQDQVQDVVTYRGIKFEWMSIWDIFPDPKALKIQGNIIAYRFKNTFGDVVKGVQAGYYFPEAISLLRNSPSREFEPVDKNIMLVERGIAPSNPRRTEYSKKFECFEFYGRLPAKWVLVRGEPIDDPDKLIPARVIFHQSCILAVEPNEDYEGEPPIYKQDYIPVNERFYGRGIPEMLNAIQEVTNETVNQRIDNVALVLNRGFGVIEKALVNREDLVSKPGYTVRLDAKYVKDVREALMPLDMPDVTQSSYNDVHELERYAQERTSANRVTLGTNGLVNDANRTATGLEILRQSAGEKFAFIGMLMEFDFLYQVFRAYWKNLYANIQPDDVIDALGMERSQNFELISPEDIEKQYIYEPQGIFTMENKALTQQRMMGLYAQFQQQPWLNPEAFFDKESQANNLDPDSLKYTPEDMQKMMMAQAHMSGQVSPDLNQSVAGMGKPPMPQGPPGPPQPGQPGAAA